MSVMNPFRATFKDSASVLSFAKWLMSNLGDYSVEMTEGYEWRVTVTRLNLLGMSILTKTALKHGAISADKKEDNATS